MPDLPLPAFRPKGERPKLSLEEIRQKGREAAAATGLTITGDTSPPAPEPEAPGAAAAERVRWGTVVRPDLLLGVRRLALERGASPFDVLEDALTTYLHDAAKRKEPGAV